MSSKLTYEEFQALVSKLDSNLKVKAEELIEFEILFNNMMNGFALHDIICDSQGNPKDYRFIKVNSNFSDIVGVKAEDLIGKTVKEVLPDTEEYWIVIYGGVALKGDPVKIGYYSHELNKYFHVNAYQTQPGRFATIFSDVTETIEAENKVIEALEISQSRENEIKSLLKSAGAVLNNENFEENARKIFEICCETIGAESGYIALLSDDGESEIIFLEPGGHPCNVDSDLPMPIWGLRAEAYESNKVLYHNDFMNSEWTEMLPEGHVILKNIMFAPLVIEGKTIGDFGLANKKTDFDDNDARLAQGFVEHAALALQNSTNKEETRKAREVLEKSIIQLRENEERFRSISTSVNDALITIDDKDRIIFWNQAAEKIFGYNSEEVLGQELHPLLTPERYWSAHRAGFKEFKKTGTGNAIGSPLELVALRKDETEFPIELSLSSYSVKDKWYAVGTIRDISNRKMTEEKTAKLLADLQKSMKDVLNLSGLLPICSHCKKIRNDSGYWQRLETFIETHSEAVFSHSICKDCMELHYPEPDPDEQQ